MDVKLSLNKRFLKRLFDFIFALIMLVLSFWIIISMYIIATFDTKSNGFFIQQRLGKNRKPFNLYKIKSMRKTLLPSSNTTLRNDPRVSKFGSFIRKTKIDELPQLFNVLLGEMSFVGPRPTVDEDMIRMSKIQLKRFDIKPGLTGLAQINGNTSLQWPQRIEYDLEYINNYSFWLDIEIIIKTIQLILTGTAETHPSSEDEWEEING